MNRHIRIACISLGLLCPAGIAAAAPIVEDRAGDQRMDPELIAGLKKAQTLVAGSDRASFKDIVGTYQLEPLGGESLTLEATGRYTYRPSTCFGPDPDHSGAWSIQDGRIHLDEDAQTFSGRVWPAPVLVVVTLEGRLGVGEPYNPLIQQCGYCEGLIFRKRAGAPQ